jgi:adenosylcobinamide amidohydrolase
MSDLPHAIKTLLTDGTNVTYALVRVELTRDYRNFSPKEIHTECVAKLGVDQKQIIGFLSSGSVAKLLCDTLRNHRQIEDEDGMMAFVPKKSPDEPQGEPR